MMARLSSALVCEGRTGEVIVVLSDDRESARLNATYRRKNKPTDVLSFSGIEEGHLGDLLISLPVAERQAREFRVSLEEELLRLIIHGTLHLLGYQHERVSSSVARRMRRREEELIQLCVGGANRPSHK